MTIVPSNKFIQVLRLRLCIFSAPVAFICGAVSTFSRDAALLAAVLFIPIVLVLWLFYLPRFANSCEIILTDTAVAVSRGVIIKRKHVLPNPRCVYCEYITTPLDALFGISAVNIRLARRTIFFDGLKPSDARFISAHISGGKCP